MTVEQRVKHQIGDLICTIHQLQVTIEELQAEIAKLKPTAPDSAA